MRSIRTFFYITLFCALSYGGVRLYYRVTDGFCLGNISSTFAYDPAREVAPLSLDESISVKAILAQEFTYFGKGCQSYVFLSQDGNYVLKFFKYQRHRPSFLLSLFSFLPVVDGWYEEKVEEKRKTLEGVFQSCKLAFEELREESNLLYVHLNKSSHLNQNVRIFDKMGIAHDLDCDKMEFILQKRVTVLQDYLVGLREKSALKEAEQLISSVLSLITSEYRRGIFDKDETVLRNLGVFEGKPMHIDVGSFEKSESIKELTCFQQELFNQTYRLRQWMKVIYPELLPTLEKALIREIGDQFLALKPSARVPGEVEF